MNHTIKKVLTIFLTLALVGCSSPVGPDPIDPSPSPSPSPSSEPPVREAPDFRISGTRFDPELLGVSFCCDDPETGAVDEGYAQGWPLATRAALHDLRRRNSRINLVHMRSGPFRDSGAAAKRHSRTLGLIPTRITWSTDSTSLREAVLAANTEGFAVEVDVLDAWGLRNGELVWPDNCSVTRSAPQARHLDWARTVARELGDLKVIYHIGNELSLCRPSVRWVRGIRDAIREVDPDAIIGSDSFPEEVDYETYHSGLGDIRPPSSRPLLHNETNNLAETADDYEAFIEGMRASGSYVAIWWGPMRNAEREELLRRLN